MPKQPKPLKALQPYKEVLEREVWGPIFWKVLHKQARDKGLSERWLQGFEAAIMCENCKEHFIGLRKRFPLELFKGAEEAAFVWHNMVSTEQANREPMSWEEYKRTYHE